jgi:hypothetical protein
MTALIIFLSVLAIVLAFDSVMLRVINREKKQKAQVEPEPVVVGDWTEPMNLGEALDIYVDKTPVSIVTGKPITPQVIAEAERRLHAENYPDRGGAVLIAVDEGSKQAFPTAQFPPEPPLAA